MNDKPKFDDKNTETNDNGTEYEFLRMHHFIFFFLPFFFLSVPDLVL